MADGIRVYKMQKSRTSGAKDKEKKRVGNKSGKKEETI